MSKLDVIKQEIEQLTNADKVRLGNYLQTTLHSIKQANPQAFYATTYYVNNETAVKDHVRKWRSQQQSN